MEIELEPSSERFDGLDDRWLGQVAQLVVDLQRDVGEVHRHGQPGSGLKGTALGPIVIDLEPVIVSLGSAGAFTAIASVITAFVTRDHGRSIQAKWHRDGQLEEIDIRGSNVHETERLVAALREAAESSE